MSTPEAMRAAAAIHERYRGRTWPIDNLAAIIDAEYAPLVERLKNVEAERDRLAGVLKRIRNPNHCRDLSSDSGYPVATDGT